jgi:hypothetical protein
MGLREKTLAVWLLTLFLIMGLGGRTLFAGIAVSPLKQEISLKPGETRKIVINMAYNTRDPSDTRQKTVLTLTDVLATEDGGLQFKDAGALKNSASKWITFNVPEATLEPGASQAVECVIAVPLDAAPGEYYSALMVTLGNTGLTDKGVVIQYRIASGIFVTVEGRTFAKEAKIAHCEMLWPQAAATQPADAATQPAETGSALPKVQVLLQNTGKARFDATGKLTVLDNQRRIVLVTPMTTRRACVFGGDSRQFNAEITKPLVAGRYMMRVEMDYQSAWVKARQEIPFEILPEQANLLAQAKLRRTASTALVQVTPDTLSSVVPPGGTRSLAITLKNVSDAEVACTADIAAGGAPGITVRPDQFSIAKGSRRTVEVLIESPKDAVTNHLSALINIAASAEGGGHSELTIPVEVQQRTER